MALSSFDDIRLPMDIERGARFIRQTRTLTTRLANGFAVRNQQWQERLSQWDIKYALQEMTGPTLSLGITAVDKFHEARHGSSRTFRFRDWTDYKLQDEVIAQADGLEFIFQITRTTTDFGNFTAVKNITKPSEDPSDPTYVVEISAAPAPAHNINFSNGKITFLPGTAVPLTDASMSVIDADERRITHDSSDVTTNISVGDLVTILGFADALNLVSVEESWEITAKVAGQIDLLQRVGRNPALGVQEGVAVTATDISFTAPDLIDSAASEFGSFVVGQFIRVAGSAGQDSVYEIATQSAAQLELVEQTITNESAGASMTITAVVISGVNVTRSPAPDGTGVEDLTVTGFFDKHTSFLEDDLVITLEWVQSGEIDNIILQEER